MTKSITLLTVLSLVVPGCATIFRGTKETVVVRTQPHGGVVRYRGREVADGEGVIVEKRFEVPTFEVDGVPVEVSYDPDPLLIADAALILFFFIPGVVAFGVDFATGAWRDFDDDQVFYRRS